MNKVRQLKWFEWTTLYSLIAIDNDLYPNSHVQSRLGAHLIQTIRQINHHHHHASEPNYFSQLILNRLRISSALKEILKQCLNLIGDDQELRAMCFSLID